ncbi:translation initiation factor if-2-related [Holotrichia oblita]|nr:translation initiation factor if-2-related [Holotrichia oblita]
MEAAKRERQKFGGGLMSKHRVHELAKEYNTTSKVIIDILSRNSIVVKNHMSSVEENAKEAVERAFARKTGKEESAPVKPENNLRKEPTEIKINQPSNRSESRQPANAPEQQGKITPAPVQSRPQETRSQFKPQPNPNQREQKSNIERPQSGQSQQNRPRPEFRQNRPGEQNQQSRQWQPGRQNQQRDQRSPGQQPRNQVNSQQPLNRSGEQKSPEQLRDSNKNNQQPRTTTPQRPWGQNDRRGGQQERPKSNFNSQQKPVTQGGFNNQSQNQNQSQGQRPPQRNYDRRNQQTQQTSSNQNSARPSQPPFENNRQPAAQKPGFNQQPQQAKPTGFNSRQPNKSKERPNSRNELKKPGSDVENISKGRQQGQARHQRTAPPPPKAEPPKPKLIKLEESITVKDLASRLSRDVGEVIKKLMGLGVMVTINQEVDFDTASLVAGEFGTLVEQLPPEEDPTEIPEIEDDVKDLVYRPPVVTVMGHVDHGKTSLLDSIRQTNVIAQEAGGITQHIGAYQVTCQNKKIVFLDTPGHEAFTSMRARGAQITDIAILVVAADDGVMPQTLEAINHAKAAKVPIIVAINKIDRENSNPDRVKEQLSKNGLIPEEWGGDTVMVPVSAYKKIGINELLEMILLVAEMLDLKANPNRKAYGTVIEAKLDKGRGPVSTILVQKGTLKIGDSIIAGTVFGKVRAMVNDRGEKVKKAEPSTPVEVLGLTEVPLAGDIIVAVDEKTARAVSEKRTIKKRSEELKQTSKVSLDDLFKQIQEGNIKDLNIVVKADVQGSIEALKQSLENLKNREVRVNIVHAGVGAINESDVMLASAANALIIGFNVRPDANSRKAADNEKIDIRTYRVIYEAINDVEAALTGMLAPEYKEVIFGRAEVRQVINVPKAVVAGSYVLEGKNSE